MKQRILVVGNGGFGRELASRLEQANRDVAFGITSDQVVANGVRFEVAKSPLSCDYEGQLIAIGSGAVRSRAQFDFPIPHLTWWASRSPNPNTGIGIIAMEESVISNNVTIGNFVVINIGSIVGHDCYLGNFVTLAPRATLGGGVRLETGCTVGMGALVKEGVRVAAGVMIGMGSVVLRDIEEPNSTWFGNPARRVS